MSKWPANDALSTTDARIIKFLLDDPIATAAAMLDVLEPDIASGTNPVREELYQRLSTWLAEQVGAGARPFVTTPGNARREDSA